MQLQTALPPSTDAFLNALQYKNHMAKPIAAQFWIQRFTKMLSAVTSSGLN